MKNKKKIFLVCFLSLATMFLMLNNVNAYQTYSYPNGMHITSGQLVSGNVDCVRYIDEPSLVVRGDGSGFYSMYWELNEFDQKFSVDGGNYVKMIFKFVGGGLLEFSIVFHEGGSVAISESATGGYVTKIYNIPADKTVKWIRFQNYEWWNPGYVYIDFCIAVYD